MQTAREDRAVHRLATSAPPAPRRLFPRLFPSCNAPGAVERHEALSLFGDAVCLELDVLFDLQLGHRLFSLLHLQDVDAPVRQVFRELGVRDHVVLVRCVRVHVRRGGRDRSELDHERVLAPSRLKVPQSGPVPSGPVPVLRGKRSGG